MSNTTSTPIGRILNVQQGRYLSKSDMAGESSSTNSIPVHGANGIIGWTHTPMYEHGVPLVTCRGSNSGMVLWADGPLWVSNNAMALTPIDGDLKFLYYSLLLNPPYGVVTGSAQPQITRRDLSTHPIFWIEKRRQQGIAATLSALDDKIDLNRRMNETLEAMARAIFRDWFVNFGPTRAKMEGRPSYLASEIWALFPDQLDEEEKPEGWSIATLAAYADLNPESWTRSTFPSCIRYVDLSGTKWGRIQSVENHTPSTAPSRAQRIIRVGDTIVGTVRPGNGSFALVGEKGLTGSTGFAVLRPKRCYHRELVYLAATSPQNIERLSHLADGGAYPAVRPETVLATEFVIAADVLLRAFSGTAAALLDQISSNVTEDETLAATRDLLLPKLMSGELRVHEAEKMAEAVL